MEKLAELSLSSLFGVYKTEEKSRLQGGKSKMLSSPKGGDNAYDNIQQPTTLLMQNYLPES